MSQLARRRRFVPAFDVMPLRLTPGGGASPMDPVLVSPSPPPPPIQSSPMAPVLVNTNGSSAIS